MLERTFAPVVLLALITIAAPASAGFGITPPYLRNTVLLAGSHFTQEINLVTSTPWGSDTWVFPDLQTPVADWISFDHDLPILWPAGQNTLTIRTVVDVPPAAEVGDYDGRIYFRVRGNPDGVTGYVLAAAVADVSLTVVDYPVVSLRLRASATPPDVVEGQPIPVCATVQNEGNTAGTFTHATADVLSPGGGVFATLQAAAFEPPVPPFSTIVTCSDAPNALLPYSSYRLRTSYFYGDTQIGQTSSGGFFAVLRPENYPPVAHAGPDQSLTAPFGGSASVTLDGSGSTDADQNIVSYRWRRGGAVVGAASVVTLDLLPGTYDFTLTVTDAFDATSSDLVRVTVSERPNAPPTADAGGDIVVVVDATGFADATLDGSASSDPDSTPGTNDHIVTFAWTLDDAPVGDTAVTVVTLPPGMYLAQLTVVDAVGAAGVDTAWINVECGDGYAWDGFSCADVDECADGLADCDPAATCENTEGDYVCACTDGYAGDGFSCVDVDECVEAIDGCDPAATCENTEGGYVCACEDGYVGDGFSCADVDECVDDVHGCDPAAICENTEGGYVCACADGYAGDGFSCVDVDE
ncbi:MAG: hypothetical protein CVU56_27825, partial [Deltaproteobacteria bacterium HGW-Deltaproteobacteria-14]